MKGQCEQQSSGRSQAYSGEDPVSATPAVSVLRLCLDVPMHSYLGMLRVNHG